MRPMTPQEMIHRRKMAIVENHADKHFNGDYNKAIKDLDADMTFGFFFKLIFYCFIAPFGLMVIFSLGSKFFN